MMLAQFSRISIVLFLLLALSACATAPPAKTSDVCSIFREKSSWHRAAKKTSERWNTSLPVAMAILYQESSFRHNARPPRRYLLGFIPWKRPSSAYGYAQVINGTWEAYQKSTGNYGADRARFADSVDFVGWYNRAAMKKNGVAVNDAYNLYLNYHEGTAGFGRGTHKKKPVLQGIALRVQQRSERYAVQYANCKDSLKRSFWRRLLPW